MLLPTDDNIRTAGIVKIEIVKCLYLKTKIIIKQNIIFDVDLSLHRTGISCKWYLNLS